LVNEWPNLNFKGHSILYLFTINKAADYSNWVQRARFTFGPRFTSAELHLAGIQGPRGYSFRARVFPVLRTKAGNEFREIIIRMHSADKSVGIR